MSKVIEILTKRNRRIQSDTNSRLDDRLVSDYRSEVNNMRRLGFKYVWNNTLYTEFRRMKRKEKHIFCCSIDINWITEI